MEAKLLVFVLEYVIFVYSIQDNVDYIIIYVHIYLLIMIW